MEGLLGGGKRDEEGWSHMHRTWYEPVDKVGSESKASVTRNPRMKGQVFSTAVTTLLGMPHPVLVRVPVLATFLLMHAQGGSRCWLKLLAGGLSSQLWFGPVLPVAVM